MKILTLISGGDVGGAKTHVLSLLADLTKTEHQVLMVCFRAGEFSQEAAELGIPVQVVSGGFPATMRALRTLIREQNFDIVHCHGSRANVMGVLLKPFLKKRGTPLVTTVHSDYRLDYMGRPLARLTFGTLNTYALRRIRYHIGVSDAMAELLISRHFSPYTTFSIYNGVDFDQPLPQVDRAAYWQSFGIDMPQDAVVVGIAARLSPVKDIATLIRGFAAALPQAPMLRLAIAGDGEQREMLQQLATQLGVEDKVYFLGWLADTASFYAAIDINTLTSLSETFPYAITEGARFARATVSSNVGGISKLIYHKVSGLLFTPGDAQALGQHLATLAGDAALRNQYGQALYKKARADFSRKASLETQLQIYETVLRREARRREHRKRDKITLCGAYGLRNAGDEAILEAILSEIRDVDPDIPVCVLSRIPKEARLHHRVQTCYTFNVLSFMRHVAGSRIYINGGGTLIQDITSNRSLLFYLSTIRIAKRLGAKVFMYGCGVGPILREKNQRRVGKVLNRCVDAITLREDHSLTELTNLGVNPAKIFLSADPALILPAAPEEEIDSIFLSHGIPLDGSYMSITVRPWPGFTQKIGFFAQAADYAYKTYGLTPVFIPIVPASDLKALGQVCEQMSAPYYVLHDLNSSAAIIGCFSRMSVILSMRLHSLVFAASQDKPLIGIAYDPKVQAVMSYIGQPLVEQLDALNADSLPRLIDEAMAGHFHTEENAHCHQELLPLEHKNREVLADLLRQG